MSRPAPNGVPRRTASASSKGIGGRLIRGLAREAAAAGAAIRLSVLKGSPARRLYERLGFSVVSEGDHALEMLLAAPA